ncbi:sporulation protein [Caproiciproducens faecalis]|uniref:Sporulation protein n=1 Tax=Caproiciproducens faecalis TaxID=2820301 RepID=A0ABS7DK33_9FIRM|nr:sporulation protein [Caproiciproducens faecalis]MBW7571647.1 sporulation protein [Caproiciproducens faecalis]
MRIKQGLLLTATFLAACLLLVFPAPATAGAKNGIGYCLQILVPSLYPFMVLSVFVVKSGLSEKIGRVFEAPCRAVLKLPGSSAASILMSAVGGYPTGARSIAALYENGSISENQASRMLCFCVNSGPAFVITAVGIGFLHNGRSGVILLVSQLAASLILSVMCSIGAEDEFPSARAVKKRVKNRAADALILSAADAARAMINMCCFVILFAAFLNLLRQWVTEPRAGAALSALLEVTGGCSDLAKLKVPLWAVSLAIGWGGICVHFQVLSAVSGIRVNLLRFMLFRLLHGVTAAVLTWALLRVFPEDVEVFSTTTQQLAGGFSGSVPAAAALIALCAALIFSLPREKLEMKEQ